MNGYYRWLVFPRQGQSPAAFTLVCPGGALGVLAFFMLHVGLVKNRILASGSAIYLLILAGAYIVQITTIVLMAALVKNQWLRRYPIEKSAHVAKPEVALAR